MNDGYTQRTYKIAWHVDEDGVRRDGYPSEEVERSMNEALDRSMRQTKERQT